MENASRALLMAGSILIAIMVISLFLLAFNQISDYQSSTTDAQKDTQLAQFNSQFTQYAQTDLKGTDLITLLNRVVDYNQKTLGSGDINYDEKITITVDVGGFQGKHSAKYLFKQGSSWRENFTVQNKTDLMMTILNEQREEEDTYGRNILAMLYSNEESLKNYYQPTGSSTEEKERCRQSGKTIKQVIGKDIPALAAMFQANNFSVLDKHGEYANFKTSTFSIDGEPTYNTNSGQVIAMSFRWVN